MITRGRTAVGGAILIGAAVLYGLFWDHLPPKTTLKRARSVTGLEIPRTAVFENVQSPGGLFTDYAFDASIRLTPSEFERVEGEALERGYTKLPTSSKDSAAHPFLARYAGTGKAGAYFVESEGTGYRMIVLDRLQLRIFVLAAGD